MRMITRIRVATVVLLSTVGLNAQQSQPSIPTTTVPRLVRIGNSFRPADGSAAAPVESVTFAIYKEEHEGAPLWQETQNVTVDAEGRYSTFLGFTVPDGLPADLFTTGELRWLGVRFNRPGEKEQPRVLLASVPYALKASDSDTLGGRPASAYLLDPNAAAGSAAGGATAGSAAGTSTVVTGKSPKPHTITGNMNYLPFFTDNSNDLGNSALYESGGNIGLGTTSPLTPLHIVTNGTGNQFLMRMQNTNSGGGANFQVYNDSGNRAQVGIYGSAQPAAGAIGTGEAYLYTSAPNLDFAAGAAGSSIKFMTAGVTERARIDPNGNLGIGTATPVAPLDVAGNVNFSGSVLYQGNPLLHVPGGNGTGNTAVGLFALFANSSGVHDTAVGNGALGSNTTACCNVAVGFEALGNSTTGPSNVAVGGLAMQSNTSGSDNTGIGHSALGNNTTGVNNIGIGQFAGINVTGGNSNNIHIGSPGASGDSATIRIGTPGTQASFYIAGVNGVTLTNNIASVVIDTTSGQLGVASSSSRYKEDIHDMGDASLGLMRLRPVTFRYKKPFADGSKPIQYGLIAEEVAEVYPDLVARDAEGQIETVKYQVLDSMLLNEVQRQQAVIEQQQHEIENLKAKLTAVSSLEERLAAVEASIANR